jgi:hypothetical protein
MTSGSSRTQVIAVSGTGRSPNPVRTHLVPAVFCALQIASSGVAGAVQLDVYWIVMSALVGFLYILIYIPFVFLVIVRSK